MSHVITLAARELREKRMPLLVMLGLGMVPVLVPMLPKLRQIGTTDVRDAFVVALLVLLPVGIAIIFGSTVIGRDLQEKRLGFYFSRPISALSIWGGKMLGAFLLVVSSVILIALPSTFFGSGLLLFFRNRSDGIIGPLTGPVGYLLALLALVAFSHAAGIILRSRSAWILLDVTLLIVVSYVMARVLDSFRNAGARELLSVAIKAVVIVALAAALIAGAVQVVRGRTDLREGHRVLSITLWSILGGMAVSMLIYAGWVFALDAGELTTGSVEMAAPRGNWVVLRGGTASRFDYAPRFLVNLDDKRSIPLQTPKLSMTTTFSKDGEAAAWVKPISGDRSGTGRISWARLTAASPEVHDTNLTAPHGSRMVFSPDQSRLAVIEHNQVSVVDLAGSRLLSSARLPRAHVVKAFFVSNDVVRLFLLDSYGARTSTASSIFELNVAEKTFKQTGDLGIAQGARIPAATAERMIYTSQLPNRIEIRDSRTAGLVAPVPVTAENVLAVALLSDGTVAIGSLEGEMARLSIIDWNGNLLKSIAIGRARRVFIGAESSPGHLTVATSDTPLIDTYEGFKMHVIDLASGKIVRTFDETFPRSPWMRIQSTDPTVSFEPGSAVSRLQNDKQNETVVILDPATGLTTPVIRAIPEQWE